MKYILNITPEELLKKEFNEDYGDETLKFEERKDIFGNKVYLLNYDEGFVFVKMEYGWHLADKPEFHLIKSVLERKEKLEKAFSLIKNKKVDVWYEIMLSVRYDDYLDQKTDLSEELTQEEFNLIKELLENDK